MAQPVKVALSAAKVSKNQRAGVKQAPKIKTCAVAGHHQTDVYVAGQGMTLQCECTGYTPINIQTPYQQRKARIRTGGKARIWFETPQQ